MGQFSIGDFTAGEPELIWGISFTPGVSGPNGEGNPGSAKVKLVSLSVGYPNYSAHGRSEICYIYDTKLHSVDEIGEPEHRVAFSYAVDDHQQACGPGSHTRTFKFSAPLLDVNATYYAYFDSDPQDICLDHLHKYTGGDITEYHFIEDDECNAQFQVVMDDAPDP